MTLPAPTANEDGEYAFDPRPVELSGETYLRLAEVDLDDPRAILTFVNTYGRLDGATAYKVLSEGQGQLAEWSKGALAPRRERQVKERAIEREKARFYPIRKEEEGGGIGYAFIFTKEELIRDAGDWTTAEEWSPLHVQALLEHHPTLVETLNEFRFAAHCLRDVETAWQALRTNAWGPQSEGDGIGFRSVLNPPDEGWNAPTLSGFFISMLGTLLQPLSPQLEVVFEFAGFDGREGEHRGATIEPQREPSELPLYTLCALELFNHIVGGVEYRFCQNERCGRRFVHQQGSSKKGQHRSRGVLYCSPACARATAQREYRRRKRTASATGV